MARCSTPCLAKMGVRCVSRGRHADIEITTDAKGAVIVAGSDSPTRAVRGFDELTEAVTTALKRPTALSDGTQSRIEPHDRPLLVVKGGAHAHFPPGGGGGPCDPSGLGCAGALARVSGGVLLIEDNEVNRDIMMRQLQALGIEADQAVDGVQGYASWQRIRPALVLLDCHMPGMDGYTLARAIRRAEAGTLPRTTIVAISANATHDDVLACRQAGMDDYLAKPITRLKLAAILEKWAETADADPEPERG